MAVVWFPSLLTKPNITYEAVRKNTIEEDFSSVVRDLAERNIKARRVVVYCQSLAGYVCISLRTLCYLQDSSYYPPGVEQVSNNRLFAMFMYRRAQQEGSDVQL